MNLPESRRKRKRRVFVRHDFHKKRLSKKWVKPKGVHAKVKLKRSGHPMPVSSGYGSPRDERGRSREGLIVRIVNNENELEKTDAKREGVIIARGVGMKKKLFLLGKANERGIKVLNLNVDDYIKEKEDKLKKRLEKKKEKEKRKEKKKDEKSEKKDEKLEEKLSEEDKKEQEKKEKDKLLTKRER